MRPTSHAYRLAAGLFAVSAGLLSHATAAELLLNGSFESPVVAEITTATPTSWTSGGSGSVALVPNSSAGSATKLVQPSPRR